MVDPSYNPLSLGNGGGGFLAEYACGCTAGWVSSVTENDDETLDNIKFWLRDGCKITPLPNGYLIVKRKCAVHGTR